MYTTPWTPPVPSPPSSVTTGQPMQPEIKLSTNNKEREMYDNMADLYSIIKTTDHLEKAFIRDSISAKEYTPACTNLIAQFKTAQNLLNVDINQFINDFRLDCNAAYKRLVTVGVPATIEHGSSHTGGSGGSGRQSIAEVVQYFITTMDSIKLNMTAVDQLQPLMSSLLDSLNKVPSLPSNDLGKSKIINWLKLLNTMKAHDELNEQQIRQLLFELESSYNDFHRALAS